VLHTVFSLRWPLSCQSVLSPDIPDRFFGNVHAARELSSDEAMMAIISHYDRAMNGALCAASISPQQGIIAIIASSLLAACSQFFCGLDLIGVVHVTAGIDGHEPVPDAPLTVLAIRVLNERVTLA